MSATLRRRLAGAPDRGSVTIWLTLSSFVMVVLVGVAVDLTGQIHAQQRTRDVAAQAARAGGQELNAARAIRGRGVQASPESAARAARTYLTAAGVSGTVSIQNGTTIVVTTSDTYRTRFLSIIGMNRMTVTGRAEARMIQAVQGVQR